MRCGWPIALLVSVYCTAQPGPWWAFGFGGPADDRITSIARGPGDTLYACGTFSGLMTHLNGQLTSTGITDIFLVKMDTAGMVYWASAAGGPGVDRATDIAVDGDGNIIVVGQFSGTFTAEGNTLTSNGPSQDIFITKWDATGHAIWARAAGSAGNTDIAERVATDGAGDVYIAGEFSGGALFGSITVNSTSDPFDNQPGDDVFIAKYSSAGDALWVRTGQAIHQDQALGLAVDAAGNAWMAGQFSADITFDQPHANAITNAAFVVAFDAGGTELWFRRVGGGGSIRAGDLRYAAGSLWLCGSQTGNNLIFGTSSTVIASAYPHSAFVVAFNALGDPIAQRTIGSAHPIEASALDVAGGEVLLGGNFECQALELSELSGGDGLLFSWGGENGWACVLDQQSALNVTYAQILADHQSMALRDVRFGPAQTMFVAGEFSDELYIPGIESKLRAWPGDSLVGIGPGGAEELCDDTTYYDAARLRSRGVLDGFCMKGLIRARRPLDIFLRTDCEFDLHPLFRVSPASTPDCTVPGFEAAFCGGGSVSAAFDFDFGPVPQYLWNTGASTSSIEVPSAGTYTATGGIGPGCFSGTDDISVGLCQPVDLPGISDDQGVNAQDTVTEAVSVCEPQLITLTAGPIPGITFDWYNAEQGYLTDTVVTALAAGVWYLETLNADGCAATTTVQVAYMPNDTLGQALIEPALAFPQDADGNDSITLCANTAIIAHLSLDLFLDGIAVYSPGNFLLSDTVLVNGVPFDAGPFNMGVQPKPVTTSYMGDGWYVFAATMGISDAPCNDHHAGAVVRDSIYVTGLGTSSSQVDIFGSIFLCSGESVTLTAVANGPGQFDWTAENGGIIGPTDGDSLTLMQAGPVQVIFTPQDTGACVLGDADTHSLALVAAPTITMDPLDGLVCPGDAVLLTVEGVSGTYTWFGPGGPLPGTTASISVSDAGTYFSVAHTDEGCEYATALQTVALYGTPYLSVTPQPVLCAGGHVVVSVEPAQGGGTYDWGPPLSGSTSSQVITAPGTYSVVVTRCGIATPLSFTIAQSSPTAAILDPGPFDICPADSVLLQAVPGLVAYVWQPGDLIGQQVYTAHEGEYALIGFDAYGCADTARSALVQVHDFDVPLTAAIDTACIGEASLAMAAGSGSFTWYADAAGQQALGTGSPLPLGPFPATTVVYVTQTDPQCTSWPVAVEAFVVPTGTATTITGDTIHCIGEPLLLSASPDADLAWDTPLGPFTGAQVDLPSITTAANGSWTVTASLSGCPIGQASVQVLVPDPQVLIVDPGPFQICQGDSAALEAAPGLADYSWYPGGLEGPLVYATDTGHYYVVGMDAYGCRDTTGLVTIGGFFYTQPLTATAEEVCAGETAIATASGSGLLTWYADAALTQPIGSGGVWQVPNITGNSTLYVTQSEAQCTSAAVAVPLPVIPLPPLPQILGDFTLCTGEPLHLILDPALNPNWLTPAGPVAGFLVSNDYATPALNGTYSAYYTNDGCAGPTASVEVSVVPLPLVDLGPPITLCIGETATLDAGPALTWLWNTGSTQQVITTGVPGTYWVSILDPGGCTDTDTLLISQSDCEVDIPNFFTPNGDGQHDVLTLSSPSDAPITLEVFNRWGQLLFTSTALVVQWDGHNGFSGEEVQEGVYFYVLTAQLVNGDPLVRKGYWQVVR